VANASNNEYTTIIVSEARGEEERMREKEESTRKIGKSVKVVHVWRERQ
jgi:hypothetical protein